MFIKRQSIFFSTISQNSTSTLLKQKLIDSPITDFSLRCKTFVYRIEKSNAELEIALFLEFNLIIVSITP